MKFGLELVGQPRKDGCWSEFDEIKNERWLTRRIWMTKQEWNINKDNESND